MSIDDLSIEWVSGPVAWEIVDGWEGELQPGEAATIELAFDPDDEGMAVAELVVAADADYEVTVWSDDGEARIELRGEGWFEDLGCRDEDGDCR
ncbi:MAG: hypothetical protein GY898_21640 [Proteobacteria bacterium]|nr:hypothetical protein [Pseudomonadota bacterium]